MTLTAAAAPMSLSSRLSRALAALLEPEPAPAPFLEELFDLDEAGDDDDDDEPGDDEAGDATAWLITDAAADAADAAVSHAEAALPSCPADRWLGVGDRVRRRSLHALRLEAIYAVAALQHAHEAGAFILGARARAARGEEAGVLADTTAAWYRTSGALSQALSVISSVETRHSTLPDLLEMTPRESRKFNAALLEVEAAFARDLLQEQLESGG